MKVSELFDDIRNDVADPSGTRWTDTALTVAFNEAVKAVRKRRPDQTLDVDGNYIAFAAVAVNAIATTELATMEEMSGAVRAYVVMRAFSSDAGDKRALARAAEARALYNEMVQA